MRRWEGGKRWFQVIHHYARPRPTPDKILCNVSICCIPHQRAMERMRKPSGEVLYISCLIVDTNLTSFTHKQVMMMMMAHLAFGIDLCAYKWAVIILLFLSLTRLTPERMWKEEAYHSDESVKIHSFMLLFSFRLNSNLNDVTCRKVMSVLDLT